MFKQMSSRMNILLIGPPEARASSRQARIPRRLRARPVKNLEQKKLGRAYHQMSQNMLGKKNFGNRVRQRVAVCGKSGEHRTSTVLTTPRANISLFFADSETSLTA